MISSIKAVAPTTLCNFPARFCLLACLIASPAWAATGTHIAPDAPAGEPQFAIATRLDRAGRIVVPVYIDDHGPYRFLLDTGATHSAVSDRLVAELHLTTDTGPELVVHGVTGLVSTQACTFETLRFGTITYPHPRLPVLGGFVLEGLDGILGMDHLINKRITADFIHDRVTVSESAGQHAGLHELVLAARTVSGLLLEVDGSADDNVVTAVIDTGASHTLGNPALYEALTRRSRNQRRSADRRRHRCDADDGERQRPCRLTDRARINQGDGYRRDVR